MKPTAPSALVLLFACSLASTGCAPAPLFRLTALGPDATWFQGCNEVRRESRGVLVAASFDRTAGTYLYFDVMVANRSDSTILIEPGDFTYALAIADSGGTCPSGPEVRAVNPELELDRLDVRMARLEADHATSAGLNAVGGLLDFVGDIALARSRTEEEKKQDDCDDRQRDDEHRRENESHAAATAQLSRERDEWGTSTLRRTQLVPGQSVGGRVAFPSEPLARFTARNKDRGKTPAGKAGHRDVSYVLRLRIPVPGSEDGVRFCVRRIQVPW